MAELWDLYTKDRIPLGKTIERGKQNGCAAYHLVVFIVVKNSRGEYLITQRAPEKSFGGKWEFTGGSVLSGEDSESAAIRETFEETGIDHSNSKRTYIGSDIGIWDDGAMGWHGDIDDLWLFEADFDIESVKLQAGETTKAAWATRDEIRALAQEKKFCNLNIFKKYADRF